MGLLSKVTVKPWEHAGEMHGVHGEVVLARPASRTGLLVFLAVISSMFLLFMITYYTRSQFADWEIVKDPGILWFNTGVLVLASLVMQLASNTASRNELSRMRYYLVAGGVLTIIFVAGQWMAWEQLLEAGYYAQINPANAFFYLFTGLHALHLLGGLWFLGLATARLGNPDRTEKVRQSVTLCATYWHYLLLVWLLMFTLLLRT
jgi:cytochrome c oxidase subunit 3